jgi:hypothetical protein
MAKVIRVFVFVVFCFFVPRQLGWAGNTISGSFELLVKKGDRADSSKGVIYYDQDRWLRVKVTSPLNQWMIFERDTLVIYYPDRRIGIRIPSVQGDVSLPIFQLAINATSFDVGLSAAGYQLSNTVVSGDSIRTTWAPPSAAKALLGNLTAIYIRDSLKSIIGTNAKGATVLTQTYSRWLSVKGRLFPCSVNSVNRSGEVEAVESIVFENVVLGTRLPPEADSLSIPADAEITTIKW